MKKSNFGLFFKKLPDDYLFESMIIFCIFFWAIPIFYFPRDIKFDLTSVPAQCDSPVIKKMGRLFTIPEELIHHHAEFPLRLAAKKRHIFLVGLKRTYGMYKFWF